MTLSHVVTIMGYCDYEVTASEAATLLRIAQRARAVSMAYSTDRVEYVLSGDQKPFVTNVQLATVVRRPPPTIIPKSHRLAAPAARIPKSHRLTHDPIAGLPFGDPFRKGGG